MAEITLDEELVKANEVYRPYGAMGNWEVASFYARMLNVDPGTKEFPSRIGAVLIQAAKQIPDEYKYGRVVVNDKGEIIDVENNALEQVDLTTFIDAAAEANQIKNVPKEVEEIKASFSVLQQQREAETPTAILDPRGVPLSDYALGEDLTLSAQEYANLYVDTTLSDLGFDQTLTFGFKGFMAGQTSEKLEGLRWDEAGRFLTNLSADEVARVQDALEKAGYFDRVGSPYVLPGDSRDAATRTAWQYFLVDAVAAGEQSTPQDVLNDRIQMMQGERRKAPDFAPKDIATLRSLANEFGRALVGRNLDEAELNGFISKAREWEIEGAQALTFAQEQEKVDLTARAEQYFDERFKVEQSAQGMTEWLERFK